MENYSHEKIEKKWRDYWKKKGIYKSKERKGKKKAYVLDMFPYPSGEGLHVGHPKGYIATDVYSRYKRMNGYAVLHPMGFDAFGLPAENYAIKTKTNPAIGVAKNVNHYKEQLEILGFDHDWKREINTTDPAYYKWTQWIFLQLYNKGLAYESHEPINWCPSCKTGLANEDVEEGKCERCGTTVEKKPMRQWVLKITDYAEKLLESLDEKDADGKDILNWPTSIKELQKNWIGKSEGAEIEFKIKSNGENSESKKIKVFTTRPDTIFGVTYVVLAPENVLVSEFMNYSSNKSEIEEYVNNAKQKTEVDRTDAKKEKTGIEIKGVKAINPANNEEIPIFVADYVLNEYGTGAVMAVPAHDERDWDFAKKYNLEIKQVIAPLFTETEGPDAPRNDKKTVKRKNIYAIVKHWSEDKYICLDWKKNNWHSLIIGGIEDSDGDIIESAKREITEETGYKNLKYVRKVGNELHTFHFAPHKNENRYGYCQALYFELLNEQSENIDASESEKHEVVWIEKDKVSKYLNLKNNIFIWDIFTNGEKSYIDDGIIINSGKFDGRKSDEIMKEITEFVGGKWVNKYKLRDWVFSRQRYWGEPIPIVHCEKCGVVPVPEKDLPVKLPKVKHYEPTGTGESPLASIASWVNTKCPKCKGKAKRETNTMPQWAGSSWYYLRYMDPSNKRAFVDLKKEKFWAPVDLYVGGAEHATRHLIYARFWHRFLFDNGLVSTKEPFKKLQHVGLIMAEDGRKMSKRWGNVVNPDDIVKTYGADTLRLYEMFMGPFDQAIAWNTDNMIGTRRFLERVWKLSFSVLENMRGEKEKKDSSSIKENYLPPYIHRAIKKVGEDIENMKFNTAVSTLMITLNEIEKDTRKSRELFIPFIKLLSPFAPHLTEEIWNSYKMSGSIHTSPWPEYDPNKLQGEKSKIIVQINGKMRGSFEVVVGTPQKDLELMIRMDDNLRKWLAGTQIEKFIYVPDKLINVVTK